MINVLPLFISMSGTLPTADTQTFGHQVTKVAPRFGGGAVTFVGDRGMIKGPQIEELGAYKARHPGSSTNEAAMKGFCAIDLNDSRLPCGKY